jgi:lipoprotein Spr
MAKYLSPKLCLLLYVFLTPLLFNGGVKANTSAPSPTSSVNLRPFRSFGFIDNKIISNKKFQNKSNWSSKKPTKLDTDKNLFANLARTTSSVQEKIFNIISLLERFTAQNKIQKHLNEKIYHEVFLTIDIPNLPPSMNPKFNLRASAASIENFATTQVFQNCVQPLESPFSKTHKVLDRVNFEECAPAELSSNKINDPIEAKFFDKDYIAVSSAQIGGAANLKTSVNQTFKILEGLKEVAIFRGNKKGKFTVRKNLAEFFSKNFGIALTDEDDPRVYEFAAKWLYTPYLWGGQSKSGIDCSGLALIFADSIYQIKTPRMVGDILAVCKRVDKQDLQQGDFVFFNRGSYVFHMGVYLKNNKFFHASLLAGVMIDDINSPYYKRYYYCGGRLVK